jgi:transposase-like protein
MLNQLPATNPTCPSCGSTDSVYRYRKNAVPEPGLKVIEAIEAKYRCKACDHEWWVTAG